MNTLYLFREFTLIGCRRPRALESRVYTLRVAFPLVLRVDAIRAYSFSENPALPPCPGILRPATYGYKKRTSFIHLCSTVKNRPLPSMSLRHLKFLPLQTKIPLFSQLSKPTFFHLRLLISFPLCGELSHFKNTPSSVLNGLCCLVFNSCFKKIIPFVQCVYSQKGKNNFCKNF